MHGNKNLFIVIVKVDSMRAIGFQWKNRKGVVKVHYEMRLANIRFANHQSFVLHKRGSSGCI